MNFSTRCSSLLIPTLVGPTQVFASIGHWSTAVYVILALHLVPVWVVGTLTLFRLRSSCHPLLVAPLAWLVSIPPALMSLTAAGILVPSLGKYIEVLLEIVLSLGLVKFIDFITALCGGQEAIVNFCTEKKILLPIGSPPIICLMPCRKPSVTLSRLSVVSFVPGLLFCYKVSILAIDVTLFLIGHQSSGEFFAYDNLHNIASFPVGLLSIYCYNMIISIMSECLPGNTKKFLGIIILIQFILFDCLRLFFIFLTGTGMLTCVPPFLSQDLVSHILKNIIKAFLATFIGLPFFKIASGKTELTLLCSSLDNSDALSSFPDSSTGGDSGIFRSQSRDLFQINRDEESTHRKRSK
eukprot:TRINITY_DN33428_c0_g1_i1.p1 TRINITY_DN33428_c0_g1~~TRINITY_DN33428_c0_g1_i1.p1  ORF type:complete len:353 (+),score=59.80 TRINITY_DN33428_c0_g1_i1:303-1361(+)